jgi:tetratricopeptide (TPR) repeat protein
MSTEYKYRAFISYSHKDEKWASWLHKALETYRVPKYLVGKETPFGKVPDKLGKVFRDREELSSAHSLGNELTQALEDSACQIVICSPNAAKSHWTNEEIKAYKRLGRENRIFCLIVGGEPYASENPDSSYEECFPHAVRFSAGPDGELTDQPSEPIAADARTHGDGKQNAKLKLISGMLGVGFDDLKQREQQRRHRRMLAITAAASVGMVFTSGLAGYAVIQKNEAERQRERAQVEAETAQQTTNFLVGLFNVSDPNEAQGNTITAREILDNGTEKIGTELADQPEIQATLMETMGTVYKSLALYRSATPLLEDALQIRREIFGERHVEVADSMDRLGEVHKLTAEYEESEAMYREALAQRRELLGPEHVDIGRSLYELADLLGRLGRFEEAEPLLREALAMQRKLLGDASPAVAQSLEGLALNQYDQGDYFNSVQLMREAVSLQRKLHRTPHTDLAEALNNLGFLLGEAGEYEESEELYRESLAMKRVLFRGEPHPEVAIGLSNVAFALQDQGKLEEAEPLYREAISMQIDVYGLEHPDVAISLNNLAFLLHDKGDVEAAIEMQEDALEMFQFTLGDDHPAVARGMANISMWMMEAGDYESAEPLIRDAIDLRRRLLGNEHTDVAMALTLLAVWLIENEQFENALRAATEARSICLLALDESHWRTASATSAEGAALAGLGRLDEAEPLLIGGHEALTNDGGALPFIVDRATHWLAAFYDSTGAAGEADRVRDALTDSASP